MISSSPCLPHTLTKPSYSMVSIKGPLSCELLFMHFAPQNSVVEQAAHLSVAQLQNPMGPGPGPPWNLTLVSQTPGCLTVPSPSMVSCPGLCAGSSWSGLLVHVMVVSPQSPIKDWRFAHSGSPFSLLTLPPPCYPRLQPNNMSTLSRKCSREDKGKELDEEELELELEE